MSWNLVGPTFILDLVSQRLFRSLLENHSSTFCDFWKYCGRTFDIEVTEGGDTSLMYDWFWIRTRVSETHLYIFFCLRSVLSSAIFVVLKFVWEQISRSLLTALGVWPELLETISPFFRLLPTFVHVFIKSWKTLAVSTTMWMVETQLCKLRGTSDIYTNYRSPVFYVLSLWRI